MSQNPWSFAASYSPGLHIPHVLSMCGILFEPNRARYVPGFDAPTTPTIGCIRTQSTGNSGALGLGRRLRRRVHGTILGGRTGAGNMRETCRKFQGSTPTNQTIRKSKTALTDGRNDDVMDAHGKC